MKAKRKSALMRWTNAGLFITTVIVIVTGVLISVELFPVSDFNPRMVQIHVYGAYVMAALVAVHILLHVKYLSVMGKKIVKSLKQPVTIMVLCGSVVIILAVGFAYFGIASILDAPASAAYEPMPPPVVEATTMAAENTDADTEDTEIATTTVTTIPAAMQNRRQNEAITTTTETITAQATTTETTTTTTQAETEVATTAGRGRERGRER